MEHGFAVAIALLNAACGGAAGAPAPKAPDRDPPRRQPGQTEDVDSLLSQLAASERELQAQLGPSPALPSSPEPSSETESTSAPEERAEPAPEKAPPRATTPTQPTTAPPPPSPCGVACRALGSMQRSAERICELTGTEDARCTGAKERVSGAEQRVARAGCDCER